MDSERWRRLDDLFSAAVVAPPQQRAAMLERECAGDPAMRTEVESLLSAHDRGSSILDSPAFDSTPGPVDRAVLPPGRRLGRYTLLRVLGRGATGIVYEARQDDPHRAVALKVMRTLPGLDELSPHLLQRETRALARLQHPGIAAIYEAGQADGWHYVAMEKVEGGPITRHAMDLGLSLTGRVELMRRVCDAVQYAHQQGVIHRDLKPSNILVTGAGQPKVLDFGLARITEPGTDYTGSEAGFFRGTLAYTSPEQAAGGATDTRSDVYSLGVVLFELLTGAVPRDLTGLPVHEAVRAIAEGQPRRLSAAPGPDAATARRLRGDLETIVAKTLESEPDRRYASAAALGDDLGRYLRGEAVEARRGSGAYTVWRTLRRHRRVAATAGAVFVLLSAASASNYVQRQHAEEARDQAVVQKELAEKRERLAEELNDSLSVLLTPRSRLADVREVLRDAVDRARVEHPGEPRHIAALLTHLAVVHTQLRDLDKAVPLLDEALKLQRAHEGRPVDLTRTLVALGSVMISLERYEEAVGFLAEAVAAKDHRGPMGRDQNFARIALGRGLLQLNDFDRSKAAFLEAWDEANDPLRPFLVQARRVADWMATLHDQWDWAEPGRGHDLEAAVWRERRDALPAGRDRDPD